MKPVYYSLIGVLALAVSVAINLVITHRYILKNKYINHSKHWWWKALLSLPAICCFSLGVWNNVKPVFAIGLPIAMTVVWFMTLFDGIFGLRVAGDFFYAGTATGKAKSKVDAFFRSMKPLLRAAIKIFLCGVTAYLYIKMFEK